MDALELAAFCVWCFPVAGAGANIGISGAAAFTAAVTHIRAGRINWRLFAWMAPPSMAGAVIGGLISGAIPDTALLLVIGAALLYFGVDLLRRKAQPPKDTDGHALDVRAAVVSGALI